MLNTIAIAAALLASTQTQPLTPREWTVDGVVRRALVHVPTHKLGAKPPLVFVFHGHGGNMNNGARSMPMHKHWPEALVVYPQGLPTPGPLTDPEGTRNGWQNAPGLQGDRDLKFFDAILADMKKDHRVDENRVYSTGHSNGGGFTYLLWSQRGSVFAAVAPCASVAGIRQVRSLKPLPVMHIAAENDELVKFAWQTRMMDAVKRINGCESESKPWKSEGALKGVEYPSKGGTPFVAVIHPGTHKYPSDAPALITAFFKEHVRKPGEKPSESGSAPAPPPASAR